MNRRVTLGLFRAPALLLLAAPLGAQSFTPTNPDTTGAIDFGAAFALDAGGTLVGFAHFVGVAPRPGMRRAATRSRCSPATTSGSRGS
jgi:hypothetical protein